MSPSAVVLEKGLPANLDAERFVLGSILLDDSYFIQTAGALQADDFSVEKHRRIFSRMAEIHERHAVLTLDSDFLIYRRHGRVPLSLIHPAGP